MRKIRLDVYNFQELSEIVQSKIISESLENIIETYSSLNEEDQPEIFKESVKICEKNMTPWFLKEVVYENLLEDIHKFLDEYYYFEDGRIACEKGIYREMDDEIRKLCHED